MKIEIEVHEDEFKKSAELLVLSEIRKRANGWGAEEYIKRCVDAQWNSCVESLILEAIENSEELRQKISREIERKLRAQLTKIINETEK